ncbi:hypothetical protein GGTG_04920 [Gaeumannomyces tritici R3-111a-1]|uniref:Uncharacterized protein n=1 Tax=Gaeumannomyces tritici (strain R3-111a-1) TaxID=644352 RepID=J3NUG4_GAET3|nr:hypothetical protein GGTG_04920 [Gaeumannomyces tritici R3-111a-1]EJT79837.1 hypothetical protein GGTG_04920 [Gaeumannomyces tritici R3-111a-1]
MHSHGAQTPAARWLGQYGSKRERPCAGGATLGELEGGDARNLSAAPTSDSEVSLGGGSGGIREPRSPVRVGRVLYSFHLGRSGPRPNRQQPLESEKVGPARSGLWGTLDQMALRRRRRGRPPAQFLYPHHNIGPLFSLHRFGPFATTRAGPKGATAMRTKETIYWE